MSTPAGPGPYTNIPTAPPTHEGPAARAWRMSSTVEGDARSDVNVAAWIMHAPGSHPWWPWYGVATIALREVEGFPPPVIAYPGATHELMVVACNPDEPLPDVPDGIGTLSHLTPVDQAVQVILPDDARAEELTTLAVRAVCDGLLVPDQDHRARWATVLAQTAEHLRIGGHP